MGDHFYENLALFSSIPTFDQIIRFCYKYDGGDVQLEHHILNGIFMFTLMHSTATRKDLYIYLHLDATFPSCALSHVLLSSSSFEVMKCYEVF